MNKKKVFQIQEYGWILSDSDNWVIDNSKTKIVIPGKSFDNIWNFILEFQRKDTAAESAFKLFTKGGKRIIQPQNYVGIIETKQKDVIEILPKIFSRGGALGISEVKKIFLKMIKSLRDFEFISLQDASLQTKKDFTVFEIFIQNYIIELKRLITIGLRKEYGSNIENINYLKGSLLFSKHILINLIHENRFYAIHKKYQDDIPQNRIIKATLHKLRGISLSHDNLLQLNNLILLFDKIPFPVSIEKDLAISENNSRLFNDYKLILKWSDIFLKNQGFTNFSGDEINHAILFPMEKLFESFIGHLFSKYSEDFYVNLHHKKFYLVSKHGEKPLFRLIPDIYATDLNNPARSVVIDTKWKLINSKLPQKNYLISQPDMYQLYAYGRKYTQGLEEPKLYLIYPYNDSFTDEIKPFFYEETSGRYHLELKAISFDLTGNYMDQIRDILSDIKDFALEMSTVTQN